MPIHSILRCQNTLHTSNMDVGSSLKPVAASILTLQHYPLRFYPKTPKLHPRPAEAYHCVRVAPYAHTQHIKVSKCFVHIQYGCGIQSEACCSLNNDITTSHRLRSTPKTPKSTPDLQRRIKVSEPILCSSITHQMLKHFVYTQYGCGIHSERGCSLSHFMTTS
jgi:hypothetical protein